MNGVKTLKFGADEYTIEDLLARDSLSTKVSKTLKNQTLNLNNETEIHLWSGYKDFTITAGTFLRAEYIDYKLDNNEWITVNLDQEGYPYTIDVTDVEVITLRGGSASIYPITLTVDLIATPILTAGNGIDITGDTINLKISQYASGIEYLGIEDNDKGLYINYPALAEQSYFREKLLGTYSNNNFQQRFAPIPTASDSGKFLRVNAQGNAEWQTVPNARGEEF